MTTPDPNLRSVTLDWVNGLTFTGATPEGHTITLDSGGASPMAALLMAAGACSGIDVVSILEKMQVTLAHCRISVTARRAADHPKRYETMTLTFHLAGEGLTQAKADRAVQLSVEKYCSVMATLDPAMPVTTEVVVEERGAS